jgi:hypothetical protein
MNYQRGRQAEREREERKKIGEEKLIFKKSDHGGMAKKRSFSEQ